jgi:hypothetical protein
VRLSPSRHTSDAATLAYLGVALDGSKVSRECDSLAADLDDGLDAYLETISGSRRYLARVAAIGDTLRDKAFPDICHTTRRQSVVSTSCKAPSAFLSAACRPTRRPRPTKTVGQDAADRTRGSIGASIPGAGHVNLDALFARPCPAGLTRTVHPASARLLAGSP